MVDTERAISNQSIDGTTDAEILERLDKLEAENERLRETVESQQKQIDELQDRADSAEQSRGHIISDIVDVESEIEEIEFGESTPSSAKGGVQATTNAENIRKFSPLGQTVSLPEHAVDSLTENQERARFVARDIQQYADMRLGELVISSGDIRKVLSAKEETSIHWQTVSRVIEYLDTMGKKDTEVKDKHGTIVCFDPEAVAEWSRSTHGVVSGEKGEV